MIKIDLRSDTFTLPDEGMCRAMYDAEVGNAGFYEDPSVNLLEQEVADFFGVEAGLFLPSATMAGQVATKVWTDPGDMVIIEEYGHSYYFEMGAMTTISGVVPRLIKGERGLVSPAQVEALIRHPENAYARSSLVILENTSNFGGGTVYPQNTLDQIFSLATDHKLAVHIDGARIWNALVASGGDPRHQLQKGGSMSVCFSKGLGAPMGALLVGSSDFIAESRRIQAMLGGVMRQVGFMAAAALYGFRHNRDRLAEDHENCALIADRLVEHPTIEIDRDGVETNLLYFGVKGGTEKAAWLVERLAEKGIGAFNLGPLIRLVTNLNVSREDCIYTADVITDLLSEKGT